jgi:hypothetical protein
MYCGATNCALSREHIIPYGLGGTATLPKSSCRDCADVTKRFEHTCLRTMFGPLRIRMNLPTSHKRERPSELDVILVHNNNSTSTIKVPAGQHPTALVCARFHLPGILDGKLPREDHPGVLWSAYDEKEAALLRRSHSVKGHRLGSFNAAPFCRMLAKIGHAYAVARMGGVEKFEPLLPDVIFNRTSTPSYWVGGVFEVPPVEPHLHKLDLIDVYTPDGSTYVVVDIRLFANLGAPQYRVVVGKRREPI